MVEGIKIKEIPIEIKQINDREVWIEKSKVFLGEDDIVYCIAVEVLNEKMAAEVQRTILKFSKMVEGKVDILVDLNNAGRPTPKAKKFFRKIHKNENVRKNALVGMHPVARVMAAFVMGISDNTNMRFFKSQEDALDWLKE